MEKNDEGPGSASPLPATARIAARLAHNLRNLLMIMGRRIDSIRGELPARSAIEEDLAELDRNLDRAFHLTHQVLEIGHPARRERVVVDLNQLVVEAERMIDRVLENVITPQFQLAATQPHVRADPYELEWILLNLVMNSREAMPTGGRLSLETANNAREVPGGSQSVIRLTVADSGQGPASKVQRTAPPRACVTPAISPPFASATSPSSSKTSAAGWRWISRRVAERPSTWTCLWLSAPAIAKRHRPRDFGAGRLTAPPGTMTAALYAAAGLRHAGRPCSSSNLLTRWTLPRSMRT